MKFCPPSLAALFILGALAPMADAEPLIQCEGEEANLQTYKQMHEVLFMQRDTSRIAEFYADELVSHNNDDGSGAGYTVVKSIDLARRWDRSLELEPQRVLEDELILCVDNFVIVRTTLKSNFVRPMAGIEPTGEPYQYTATDIYRFDNGKVVERWGNNDLASAYRQLGFKISRD
ncbi:MAG: putative ester cyclase [Halioglobus sp.]|jgi:predicted ester cyclase